MNKIRPESNDITLDCEEPVTIEDNENFQSIGSPRSIKYHKWKSINSFKILLIILLFYFVGYSEAHAGNPILKKSRNADLIDSFADVDLAPSKPFKGFEMPTKRPRFRVANPSKSARKYQSSDSDSSSDSSDSSDSDTETTDNVLSPQEQLSPEAKKVFSSSRSRRERPQARPRLSREQGVPGPFAKRLARPVESDAPPFTALKETKTPVTPPQQNRTPTAPTQENNLEEQDAYQLPDTTGKTQPNESSPVESTNNESNKLVDIPYIDDNPLGPPAEETSAGKPEENTLLKNLSDGDNQQQSPAAWDNPFGNQPNLQNPIETPVPQPNPWVNPNTQVNPEVTTSAEYNQAENPFSRPTPEGNTHTGDISLENVPNETIPVENQAPEFPPVQSNPNPPAPNNPLQGTAPQLHPVANPPTVPQPNPPVQNTNAEPTSAVENKNLNENAVPPVVEKTPKMNESPSAPPTQTRMSDVWDATESVTGPSANIFTSGSKPSFFNKNEVKQSSGFTTEDDFDLQEVERVNTNKIDPRITQQIDNEWLRKQKQSQMIGTQIPVATSYEYNRAAHVLEPKFESPKLLGGIIQTLTDKESKLRRMEKRKLKIQHDLNLYISKESANVVNMLNNGEVNKLQKVHPLVYMRLLEVFQTQHALDAVVKKDGDKVKKYDKSWYLNSSPTSKASFIEEIRRYSKDTDLYGKFKRPSKIDQSKENVYKKLELFHNDYICQRVVRENQYSQKVLRSLEQQSGLYVAPFYHNVVPGLGNLWLMKNFERYYMEAVRSKVTTFGKIAPLLVGKFMLMVENGTILPSTPSSQVAIHALTIMLALIMDGVKEPSMFLGKNKFYGFMSLCDSNCADLIFEEKGKKDDLASKQVEFLKWVLTFHSEDLILIDTYAQRIVLNNMYAVTREDIYRTSPRNIQLRIQSEFSSPRVRRRESFLELNEEDKDKDDEDGETTDGSEDYDSFVELESELTNNRERELRDFNRRLLEQHGEKKRQEYRKMQLEKVLEQQRKEVQKQQEAKESDTFQKAMKEREKILKMAEERASKPRPRQDASGEKTLFVKEVRNKEEEENENEMEERKSNKDKNVYHNVKSKLESLGSTYDLFLKRFMSGYHAPGRGVDSDGTSDEIVPFHVFVPSNKTTGGYDGQFLDVVQTLTDLVNLAHNDCNAYYHSLNTFLMIRTIHGAVHSFESGKTKNISGSRTLGSLFRWLNTDSNRYLSHVPKKYLPFTSLSLQLLFFFQELVESYNYSISNYLTNFFRSLSKKKAKRSFRRPRRFSNLNRSLDTYVIYDQSRYHASLQTVKQLVDMFKDKFLSKPSIPSPIIQYMAVFIGLWAQSDSEKFTLSERGAQRAKKMFFLAFLSNQTSLADMATKMVLNNCKGLRTLHLGCVSRVSSTNRDCKQISVRVKKSRLRNIFRIIEATSIDPLDVIRIASDTCRRCAANLLVRPQVGAPVISYLELEKEGSEDSNSDASSSTESDDFDEDRAAGKEPNKKSDNKKSESDKEVKEKQGVTPANPEGSWTDMFKNKSKKERTEEEEMELPHFVDRLMLHSEITHRVHCYETRKELVKSLITALAATKDEMDARQIVTNVFAQYRTIEVVQSGMASSIHRLICPYMIDAPDSVRVPLQTSIIKYAVSKVAKKVSVDLNFKELFKGLTSKVDLLVPTPDGYAPLPDIPGCVFVGSRKYNGVYFAGGYAPFPKIDKPTNIMLKPGEGRLVYDGDNFVPELRALSDVSDLQSINVVHERDFDKYVYQVRGEKGPVMVTERKFALEYPNFVVRAHVIVTAKALMKMGFDMGRVIWCGDKYGWVADFVLNDLVPVSDVPVYNGHYWLLSSQLSVKDVVGSVPVRFVNQSYRQPATVSVSIDEDEEHLGDKPVRALNVEIRASGKKVGELKSHGSESEESLSDEDEEAAELLMSSGGDSVSATPGAVKSVRSAVFNPENHKLTLDLDMPDFVFSG
ncbi:hypothetical protein MACJ_000930 [Theileria orientalis]|uniref:Uncharacterized protein n=1 Tax=Theileria orientalis TaxID=68886 RepID=A0A976QS36_THEOR|nr:hypothetical protein MACJ_000930 [Theileria orientalis]